jgi:proteasome lid subunit RPN8/RPN11
MSLRIARAVRSDLVSHALAGTPAEICGVLAGTHGDESVARASAHATNAAAEPQHRYELDPAEQLELMRDLEADGDEVVGFYHSHPRGPPEPSDVDADEATWAGYSYVIVSLHGDPVLTSWRWTGGGFEREPVRGTGDRPSPADDSRGPR